MSLAERGDPTTRWMKTEDMARTRALQMIAKQTRPGEEEELQLPFDIADSTKLLGLRLDSHWSFRQAYE